MAMQIVKFAWVDVAALSRVVVPPLQSLGHKGSGGRVGVIGGSQDYCGAPFYSAISTLKFGADLSWIYCSQSAAIPIKSYSPELMVSPFYDDATILDIDSFHVDAESQIGKAVSVVSDSFPRLHSLVVGPGLGRNINVMGITASIIRRAREKNLPLVIDADGLWLVTQDLQTVMGYSKCILTPNQMEFERLVSATVEYLSAPTTEARSPDDQQFTQRLLEELRTPESAPETETSTAQSDSFSAVSVPRDSCPLELAPHVRDARRVHALSAALGGVTVLRKGSVDIIAASLGSSLRRGANGGSTTSTCNSSSDSDITNTCGTTDRVYVLAGKGSPRRCGGLGDILSGTTATALHWALQRSALLAPLTEITGPSVQTYAVPYSSTTTASDATQQQAQQDQQDLQGQEARNAALHACIFASVVSKKASEVAFAQKGRSMTAPDVIEKLGEAFQIIYPEG